MSKPVIEILEEAVRQIHEALASAQTQRAALVDSITQLQRERDDLQAAINFMKARRG